MITARSISQEELNARRYENAVLPMSLRFIDSNPNKRDRAKKQMEVLVAFTTVYFARETPDGSKLVCVNARFAESGVYVMGRGGSSELVFDATGLYLVTQQAYLASYQLRLKIGEAYWDVVAYYFCDARQKDLDEYSSVEQVFDHDDRIWQACTMGGYVIPQKITVARIPNPEAQLQTDLDKLPLINGKHPTSYLCLFDNVPELPPDPAELEVRKPGSILGPTGQPIN